jgi:hypothetical protein
VLVYSVLTNERDDSNNLRSVVPNRAALTRVIKDKVAAEHSMVTMIGPGKFAGIMATASRRS